MNRIWSSVEWSKFRRFSYPLIMSGAIRLIGAVWLFEIFSQGGKFHTGWMDANPNLIPLGTSWLWLFNAWDSLQFPLIAIFGYDHPNYVRLPAYPLFIRVAGVLTGNYWFGAFLVTQIFALASIVVFQLLAEDYMKPNEALNATLLMSAFPFIFVFMTLSYSESLFFFSIICSWYFYKKEQLFVSSLFAGLASVTKIYGILIVLPIIFDLVSLKRYARLIYQVIPVSFLLSWVVFCYRSSGDFLASWDDEKFWTHGANGDGVRLVQAILHHGLQGVVACCSGLDPTIFWSVALFVIVVARIWQIDRCLWVYAVSLSGLLIFTAPFYISLLRFLVFIFPIWLTVRVRNRWVAAVSVVVLVPLSLIVWLFALQVTFIG